MARTPQELSADERTAHKATTCVACTRTGTRLEVRTVEIGAFALCADAADCLRHARKVGIYGG